MGPLAFASSINGADRDRSCQGGLPGEEVEARNPRRPLFCTDGVFSSEEGNNLSSGPYTKLSDRNERLAIDNTVSAERG